MTTTTKEMAVEEALAVLDPLVPFVSKFAVQAQATLNWERLARDARSARTVREFGDQMSERARVAFGPDASEECMRSVFASLGKEAPKIAPRVKVEHVLELVEDDEREQVLAALEAIGDRLAELEDRECSLTSALATAAVEGVTADAPAFRGAVQERTLAVAALTGELEAVRARRGA